MVEVNAYRHVRQTPYDGKEGKMKSGPNEGQKVVCIGNALTALGWRTLLKSETGELIYLLKMEEVEWE